MRPSLILAAVLALVAGPPLRAQSLASRVAQAPDGVVHMEFDARPGVCGDGRDMVGFGHALFSRSFESMGRWHNARCVAGPIRVVLVVARGRVTALQTQIGGAWPSSTARVTELGIVSSRDASAYFFTLVPQLESATGKDRLLLPAVLADDGVIMPSLLALARDDSRTDRTRRSAIQWIGLLGDASEVPALVAFAKQGSDGEDGDHGRRKGLGSAATASLSYLPDGAGIPALIELARNAPIDTRRNAVFWLGQSGDPRALRMLHTVIENSSEENKVRQHAIFSLANNDENPPAEFDYLRSVYGRLDNDQLKESVLQGIAQDREAGGRWLIQRARDASESQKVRRSALFWAGQREATATADLVAFYRDAGDRELREHAIFVLSQRHDETATNALIDIARTDTDTRMRGKALFWLAQKNDSRVTRLISDLLVK